MGQKNGSGYFLIEIGIVVALLLIIVALTVPNVSFLRKQCVAAEIDKLCQFFHFCAQQAIVSGRPQLLTFDVRQGSYVCGNFKEILMAGVCFGIHPKTYGPPSSPTKLIKDPVTFDKHQIIFYPDGSMQAGAIYLTDKQKTFLYALTTPVSSVAYMRKYAYLNKSWSLLN